MSLHPSLVPLVWRLQVLAKEDALFLTSVSPDPTLQSITHICHSNFLPGIALDLLSSFSLPELQPLCQTLADHLAPEVNTSECVNYWHHSASERDTRPYPDDLDTAACVLAGLARQDPRRLNGESLARLVQLLIRVETAEGGPYKTWLAPPNEDPIWHDTDVAVNANIAYLLSLYDVRLEALDAWLGAQILEGRVVSPYYPSPVPLWYFLARGYVGPATGRLVEEILAQQLPDGGWGLPQDTALAITALHRLQGPDEAIQRGRRWLTETLAGTDEITPSAFCMDSLLKGVPMYAGSELLTIALCLEALTRIEKPTPQTAARVPEEARAKQEIQQLIATRTQPLPETLRTSFQNTVHRITGGHHGDEILLLPYRFNDALKKPFQLIDQQIALQLGAVNAYGWMAYTLSDDILDGEADGSLLPVANTCLREVTAMMERLSEGRPLIAKTFHHIMDTLEEANAWEVQHARIPANTLPTGPLPDYGTLEVLANRSLGHALGPVTILLLHGAIREAQATLQFFRSYLIARQLDDDAHDWEEDLRAGRINAVGTMILRAWRDGGYAVEASDEYSIMALRRLFQRDLLPDVARLMLQHIERAEVATREIQALANPMILLSLLKPVRDSAETALRTHREARGFLETMRGPGV